MRKTALIAPLVALLAVATLTACDPPGLAIPTPTASVSVEPSQTPEEEAPVDQVEITRVMVGPDMVALGDDTAFGVEWFPYTATGGDAVNVLKLAFGPSPVITEHPAGMETGPYRSYDWGGFELREAVGTPSTPPYTPLTVIVTAGSIGGVTIFGGAESVKVGGPMAAAITAEAGHMVWGDEYQAWLEPRPVDPVSVGEAAGSDLKIFVAVYGPVATDGTVTRIVSPTPNWGV